MALSATPEETKALTTTRYSTLATNDDDTDASIDSVDIAVSESEKTSIMYPDDKGNMTENVKTENKTQRQTGEDSLEHDHSLKDKGSDYSSLYDDDPKATFENESSWIPQSWHNYLFPPDVPRPVQLLRKENIAVPACYLVVGLLQGLSGPLINVYPLDLGASEAQQATISSLRGLPATFKLAFGFISDNIPLFGYRRKSYMLLGWILTALTMFSLLTFSDLDFETVTDAQGEITKVAKEGAPSVAFLSASFLLFGTGFWFADVMADSIVAEKAKLEPEETRGSLQSTCYACRFFGLMVAAPFSTVIYSSMGPKFVIAAMGVLPAVMVPLIIVFWETRNVPVKSTAEQCSEIWNTVCSRSVWQPMGFVYLYNLMQVGNAAWREFLKSVLGFTSNQLNSLLIAAYVLLYFGIIAYKNYFIHWSWRSVYIWTTMLNGFFSALQVLLIQGITFGISPFWFALGDDVFSDFISGIQFLPTTIMMVQLCPSGSEGASYAMFTTVNNSALTLSSALSTMLLGIWDVSKETMVAGDLSGMTNLTILTTVIQTSAVIFVGLLPRYKEDLIRLAATSSGTSKIGGFVFLSVTFLSITYAIVVGILNIVSPGWMGES